LFEAPPAEKVDELQQRIKVFYTATIDIEALTEDFYPVLYMRKIETSNDRDDKPKFSSFEYPNINEYEKKFGEFPYNDLHKEKFTYSFCDFSSN